MSSGMGKAKSMPRSGYLSPLALVLSVKGLEDQSADSCDHSGGLAPREEGEEGDE
jgi:hypothetical protein